MHDRSRQEFHADHITYTIMYALTASQLQAQSCFSQAMKSLATIIVSNSIDQRGRFQRHTSSSSLRSSILEKMTPQHTPRRHHPSQSSHPSSPETRKHGTHHVIPIPPLPRASDQRHTSSTPLCSGPNMTTQHFPSCHLSNSTMTILQKSGMSSGINSSQSNPSSVQRIQPKIHAP